MNDQLVDETPWEVSVLTALLNMRWLHQARGKKSLPDLINALDGPAETALGDVLLKEDDRLFLFELKASWTRATSEAKKPIFTLYEDLHAPAQQEPTITKFDELLLGSIRCHHLLYWEDDVALSDGSVRGSISFSPYALFVLDRVIGSIPSDHDFRHSHALALARHGATAVVEAASIESLFDGSATAASGNLISGEDVEFAELGLDQSAFLEFVQSLRGEDSEGDIIVKLIAFSPVSGFLRRISSLDEAVQLGLDWAENTASAKPVGPKTVRRTSKPRMVGKRRLLCAVPIPPEGTQRAAPRAIKLRRKGT